MSRKNKILASVLATSMVAASALPLSVEAVQISGINSKFEYDLSVEYISQSQIKVTFFSTYNPGVSYITTYLVFDASELTANKCMPDIDLCLDGKLNYIPIINNSKGIAGLSCQFYSGDLTADDCFEDYLGDFEFSFYLTANDGNIYDGNENGISVAVTRYNSKTENIDFDYLDTHDSVVGSHDATIAPWDYQYIVGDTDESGGINIADSSNINAMVAVLQSSNNKNVDNSVSTLNNLISNNESSQLNNGSTVKWGGKFNYFMRSLNGASFSCVESADANQDGFITLDDSKLVLDWYSQIASENADPKDIEKIGHKTIYL